MAYNRDLMSTLYRKYRPAKFSDVIGHEAVVSLLRNEIILDIPSHAYLFSGVRGVGKTTFARLIARALNCQNREKIDKKKGKRGVLPGDPCGKCDSCLDLEKGVFPDTVEIDAASNRGIDEIRSLKERVAFAPMRGRYKVYIIDEAHMLTREAFNALLKTLEEPPKHVVFVLCTTEAHKLPETIISRCQWFELKLATPEQLATKLKEIAKAEKVKVDEDVFALVARVAGGSFRDGESLFGSLLAAIEKGKPVDISLAKKILNIPGRSAINRLYRLIIEGNSTDALCRLERLKQRGYSADKLIDALIEEGSLKLFELVSREQISRCIALQKAFIEAKRNMSYLMDSFIALELIIAEFKTEKSSGQAEDGGKKAADNQKEPVVNKAKTVNNREEWGKALLAIESAGCQLAAILSCCAVILAGDTLKVVVKNAFELGVVSAPKNQALLRKELGIHMPDVHGIICEIGTAEDIDEKELGSIFT